MTEQARGLVIGNENLERLAPILFAIWARFNLDNEPGNCVKVVDVSKWKDPLYRDETLPTVGL